MKQEPTQQATGGRATFLQLFTRHPQIKIPIIQRDYAHGRPSAEEVRTEFLNAIFQVLSSQRSAADTPLDLDFVYGSKDEHSPDSFLPLDGQQRLTTLFLLHWYLAWLDGRRAEFTAGFTFATAHGHKSKLRYAVRQSSEDFFDGLINYVPAAEARGAKLLSEVIKNQPWFFRSWKLDPTIVSALEVLDTIHAKFAKTAGCYDRLVESDPPYLAFQLLDLDHFGLSDDLYVKMNARGKPLTPFETFKARLEKKVAELFAGEVIAFEGREIPLAEYLSFQLDTKWADLFWHYRDTETCLFDDRIMGLVRTLAIVTRDPDEKKEEPPRDPNAKKEPTVEQTLEQLRDRAAAFSFFKYVEHKCIDHRFVRTLLAVLDRWSGGNAGKIRTFLPPDARCFDEEAMFVDAITNNGESMTYTSLIRFHAYCIYLARDRDEIQSHHLAAWMRVVSNLAINTGYNTPVDFLNSIRSVNGLLAHADNILEYLDKEGEGIRWFSPQQVREERIKAQLILKDRGVPAAEGWKALISVAEQHGYFEGQIEFLLKFSGVLDDWLSRGSCEWSDEADLNYREKFSRYFAKADAVFDAAGLRSALTDCRWERALLAIGDYLLDPTRSNWSFLTSSGPATWKRLLRGPATVNELLNMKRGFVGILFDKINLEVGVAASLDQVINTAETGEEWRRLCVERPELIQYCWGRQTRWPDENESRAYLLRGQRMNGEHAELFTYYLSIGPLADLVEQEALRPFVVVDYKSVNTDSIEPFVFLEAPADETPIVLEVRNTAQGLQLKLFRRNGELPAALQAALSVGTLFEVKGHAYYRTVDWSETVSAITELASAIRASGRL